MPLGKMDSAFHTSQWTWKVLPFTDIYTDLWSFTLVITAKVKLQTEQNSVLCNVYNHKQWGKFIHMSAYLYDTVFALDFKAF